MYATHMLGRCLSFRMSQVESLAIVNDSGRPFPYRTFTAEH